MQRVTGILAYAVAALLVLGLADAALATSLARQPAGLAAAALAIAILLIFGVARRRLNPILGAALALLAASALVAFAATVGGGRPDALLLTGFDSGRVTLLVAVLLLALLALATALARIPLAVKALALVIELYAGVGALAHLLAGDGITGALAANTPYPFDAAWIRAVVIAGAALLPLGALAALAAGLMQLRRRPAMAASLVAFALALAFGAQATGIALLAAGLPTVVAFEGQPAIAIAPAFVDGPAVDVTFRDDIATNVRAEAARVGSDRRKLFTRVAAQTADEAYPGALRGASGTLSAGGGNAVDKALLLRDLIRATNPSADVRFASCTLSPGDARMMASGLLATRRARPQLTLEQADRIAAQAQGASMQAVMRQWSSAWHGLVTIVHDEGAALATTLGHADPGARMDVPSRVAGLVAPQVWLQEHDGLSWTDLDPTLGAGGFGRARCAAEQTASAPPADRFSRVTVRLTIEERQDGVERVRDMLAARMRIADLAGRNLSFLFAEPSGMAGATPSPAPTDAATANTALAYTPVLLAGDQRITGTTFSVALPPRGPSMGSAVTSAVGSASTSLGQIGTSPSPSPSAVAAPSQPTITAAWLRLSIDAPGAAAERISSTLFDRIGPAARSKGNTAASLRPLPLAGGEVAPLTAIWNIAIWSGAQAAGVGDVTGAADPASPSDQDVDTITASLGHVHSHLAALRMALFESAAGAPGQYVLAKPGVTLLASGSGFAPATDVALMADVASDGLDIVGSGGTAANRDARAMWSVASVVAERLVGDGARELTLGAPAPTALAGNDAIATFAAARRGNITFTTIDPAHRRAVTLVDANDDVRALVAADVDAGDTVLVPKQVAIGMPQLAWFSVDPQTGAVTDTMANGRHTEMTEEGVQTEETTRKVPFWRRFGKKVACAVSTAGAVLALAAGNADAAWAMAKIPAKIAQEEEKWRKIGEAACKATGGTEGAGGAPK